MRKLAAPYPPKALKMTKRSSVMFVDPGDDDDDELYFFTQLDRQAQERAIDSYGSANCYPDWDDVGTVTEMLSEFATNCLGFNVNQLYWSADGQDRGVGINGSLDLTKIATKIAAQELNPESKYGKTSGADIIKLQEPLMAELVRLKMVFQISAEQISCPLTTDRSSRNETATLEHEYEEYDDDLECLSGLVDSYVLKSTRVLLEILDAEIDYRNSADAVREELENRDIYFNKAGTRYSYGA